jgi:hypothetical protein
MRCSILVLGSVIVLTACSGDPRSYGITGPGTAKLPPQVPTVAGEATPTPGVPTPGSYYGPTHGPSSGDSGFWGYNN